MNSRNDKQLNGEIVSLQELESSCGNKTMENDLILNPCGSVANSLFNDIFTLVDSPYELIESGISWKYDRDKFHNPPNYGAEGYKWL